MVEVFQYPAVPEEDHAATASNTDSPLLLTIQQGSTRQDGIGDVHLGVSGRLVLEDRLGDRSVERNLAVSDLDQFFPETIEEE